MAPKLRLSERTRVAIAFAGFATIIAGSMLAVFSFNIGSLNSKGRIQGQSEAKATEFFYKSIGKIADSVTADNKVPAPPPEALYTVELGVFDQRQEAENLVAALQAQGQDAFYTPLNHEGHVIYRVRRGLFQSEAEAQKAAVALRSQGQAEASVVSLQ